MKSFLFQLVVLIFSQYSFAQAPTISGNLMLCPNTTGTAQITSVETYNTYQWYFKYWFLPDNFQPIAGANASTFTYDWFTYDQALLKVVVTSNGQTFESNTIQIDSHNWTPISLQFENTPDLSFDPDTECYLLCEGGTFELSINNPPYNSNTTWYNSDVPIAGASGSSLIISQPGNYKVSASPSFCANSLNTSVEVNVVWNPNCTLSIDNPTANNEIKIYPNPVNDVLKIELEHHQFETYKIVDLAGKTLLNGNISNNENSISVIELASGIYTLQLSGDNKNYFFKIVKE